MKLNYNHIHIVKNLNNVEILNKKLKFLFYVRCDQVKQHIKISSHVKYNKLFKKIAKTIEKKMIIEKTQIKKSKTLLKLTRKK